MRKLLAAGLLTFPLGRRHSNTGGRGVPDFASVVSAEIDTITYFVVIQDAF